MSLKVQNNRLETEQNVKFTVLGPYGETIGIFLGTWDKAITETPAKANVDASTASKHTFNGVIDDKAQATFFASLSERRIFRNIILKIETEDGTKHSCQCNLTVAAGTVKGSAVSPVVPVVTV
jgi:hypothetical protein